MTDSNGRASTTRERALRKREADEDALAEVIGGLESPAGHYLRRRVVPLRPSLREAIEFVAG
jgi:hypothetical protein